MPKVASDLRTPAADIIDAEITSIVPYEGHSPAVQESMPLAQIFAASGIFQDSQKAAQAVVKIIAGRDLGIPPTAAMTGLYLVKGRITLSANLMAALVKRSSRYNYRVTHLDAQKCEIQFTDAGEPCGTSVFSLDDAKLAGISGGDNWRKYPRNMLFARALSNGVRWFCPDLVLGGAYTADEIGSDLASTSAAAAEWLPEPDTFVS